MSDFYSVWKKKSKDYAGVASVACFIPLVGYFDLRGPDIFRFIPAERNAAGIIVDGRTEKRGKESISNGLA